MCHVNLDYKDRLKNTIKLITYIKAADNNPLDFLETVINLSDKNICSFHKIFPEHLINCLTNKSLVFVVKRNFIDVYISKKGLLR